METAMVTVKALPIGNDGNDDGVTVTPLPIITGTVQPLYLGNLPDCAVDTLGAHLWVAEAHPTRLSSKGFSYLSEGWRAIRKLACYPKAGSVL